MITFNVLYTLTPRFFQLIKAQSIKMMLLIYYQLRKQNIKSKVVFVVYLLICICKPIQIQMFNEFNLTDI